MTHLHLEKKGLRGLAISESFKQGDTKSRLAGVVMRRDFVIDGFVFGTCTVEGDDATESILEMYVKLERSDINFILVSGLIIAMYNIVDMAQIYKKTGLPVIGVTYEESAGIQDAIRHHFPNSSESKISKYEKLGQRHTVTLHSGYDLHIRTEGCTVKDAKTILDTFTLQGSIPEPIRVAHLLAKSL